MEIEKTTATIKEYIQSKGIDLMSFEIEEIASVITRFDRDIQLKILKKADLTSKDYIREGRGGFIWNDFIPEDKNSYLKFSIGYWKNDKREGFQKEYNKYNFCIFEGNYINNNRNGLGNLFWDSGESFHGFFKNGKRNGFGIIFWKDGSKWEGNFIDGVMNGKGIFYPSHTHNSSTKKYNNYGYITFYQNGKFIKNYNCNIR